MYDHVGLKVKDMDASVRFYTAALKAFGHVLCSRDDSGAGFGPPGEPALWLYPFKGSAGPGTHVAFRASDRSTVDRFHRDGLKAGGRDHGAPGLRPHLLRGVPAGPRRQQRRGGLHAISCGWPIP